LAGSYGDDSAQIAAATAAAVAAAAESGLGGVVGRKPPRVPSTLGVDEEFEGPDTSSLAAFLLSLISINPRGNKASSDTCSESGGSYADSDFEEEDYEEVGEEDTGVVEVMGREEWYRAVWVQQDRMGGLPDMMEESFLLSDTCRSVICQSLPAIASGREWVLLYSTFKHGISLSTLYRRSSMMPGPCLLVVTEDNGTVFGGFSSQALVASNRRKYQGSSDVFVFTTTAGEPTVYKVTAANRYFILCLNEALSFGGGGHFALCLQEDLLTGSSGACETFCSPCLSKSEDFKIKHVE
ncbi:unnamed protein product, partial [Closterium sp. Naga37s-1]